jgi:ferulate-5-hydroxylase
MAAVAKIAMEWLQDPLSCVFLVTLAVVLLQLRRRGKAPLPPGPKPLPIVGNMAMMDQLTHRGLAALADKYGGLLHLRLGRLHAFAVSTPEYAREVLQTHDGVFSNRPATIAIAYLTYDRADMAFAHYGPFWRQMRKLCVMKLFSRRRAETWVAVRDECAALVRAVATSGGEKAVNLGELIFTLTKNVTFRAAFGTRDGEDQEEFIAILQEFSKLFGAFNIGDFLPWLGWMDLQGINRRLRAARSALDRFIDKIIDEHVKRGKSPDDADADMVDDMLAFFAEAKPAAVNGGAAANGDDLQNTLRLTRDNIKAIIMVRVHTPSSNLQPPGSCCHAKITPVYARPAKAKIVRYLLSRRFCAYL